MTIVGSGKYTYELIESWAKLPEGETFGMVSAVATDTKDRVYAFQRKDPPIVIFNRDGSYVGSWGFGAITNPHGIFIKDDIVYITDRDDSVWAAALLDCRGGGCARRGRRCMWRRGRGGRQAG